MTAWRRVQSASMERFFADFYLTCRRFGGGEWVDRRGRDDPNGVLPRQFDRGETRSDGADEVPPHPEAGCFSISVERTVFARAGGRLNVPASRSASFVAEERSASAEHEIEFLLEAATVQARIATAFALTAFTAPLQSFEPALLRGCFAFIRGRVRRSAIARCTRLTRRGDYGSIVRSGNDLLRVGRLFRIGGLYDHRREHQCDEREGAKNPCSHGYHPCGREVFDTSLSESVASPAHLFRNVPTTPRANLFRFRSPLSGRLCQ